MTTTEIDTIAPQMDRAARELAHSNGYDTPDAFARGYVLEEGSDAETTLSHAHVRSFGSDLESFVTPGYLDKRVFENEWNLPQDSHLGMLAYATVQEQVTFSGALDPEHGLAAEECLTEALPAGVDFNAFL